jgi:alkyl-hydroperoxide reductase/thiol specific antioxidant family protein
LRDFEDEFRRKGARLAAVGLGDFNYARLFREKTGIKFPLLVDDKREAYKAVGLKHATLLHLLRRDNMKARKRASAAGHKQHRLGKDPLQLGGSFVFAPGNKDLFVHVSETFGDNASPKEMLAAL